MEDVCVKPKGEDAEIYATEEASSERQEWLVAFSQSWYCSYLRCLSILTLSWNKSCYNISATTEITIFKFAADPTL